VAGNLSNECGLDAEEAELQVRVKSLQVELEAKQVEKAIVGAHHGTRRGELTRGRTRMGELRGADAASGRQMKRAARRGATSSSGSTSRAILKTPRTPWPTSTALCPRSAGRHDIEIVNVV